jgi:hypothetical protein
LGFETAALAGGAALSARLFPIDMPRAQRCSGAETAREGGAPTAAEPPKPRDGAGAALAHDGEPL